MNLNEIYKAALNISHEAGLQAVFEAGMNAMRSPPPLDTVVVTGGEWAGGGGNDGEAPVPDVPQQ